MKTQQTKHEESGCTDYLQHNAESCPVMAEAKRLNKGETLNQFADSIIADSTPNKAQHSPLQEWMSNEAYKHDASTVAIMADLKAHADKLAEALRNVRYANSFSERETIITQALAAYEAAQ